MSEHIRHEQALALMALAHNDPERLSAESHAATCSNCRALLREADLMLGWIDESMQLAPVGADLKDKIRGGLEAQVKTRSSSARLLLWAGLVASLLFALLDGAPGELRPMLGLECMLFEGLCAVGPFSVAAWLALRGSIAPNPLNLAVISMAGGLVGQAILHFRCESTASAHLLLFHVTGVALAAWLGYAASVRLVQSRVRAH